MKNIFLISAFLFMTCGLLAQTPAKDYVPRSKDILDLMKQKEFGKIALQFDSSVSNRLDSAKLAGVWERMIGTAGPLKSVDSISTDHQENYDVVIQHCVFEKKKIDFKLVYGLNEKIKGIFFLPVDIKLHYEFPPYYHAEEFKEKNVIIENGEIKLPGILTLPAKEGNHPVVILIHGSGPNDRDETVGPTKVFKDLAIGLSAKDVAVLRYDKRTRVAGRKVVDMMKKMTVKEEMVDDVLAAIELVKKEPGIDTNQIFLLGHSFGGMLLPRINSKAKNVKGLIYFAANSRPLEDLYAMQAEYIIAQDTTINAEKNRNVLDSIRNEAARIKKLTPANAKDTTMILRLSTAYWLDLKTYNPVKQATTQKTPMLFLHGGRDYQVTDEDFNGWKSGLNAKSNVKFKLYPSLNHFFITGEGKSTPKEYMQKGNVSSEVIDDISSWIQSGQIK